MQNVLKMPSTKQLRFCTSGGTKIMLALGWSTYSFKYERIFFHIWNNHYESLWAAAKHYHKILRNYEAVVTSVECQLFWSCNTVFIEKTSTSKKLIVGNDCLQDKIIKCCNTRVDIWWYTTRITKTGEPLETPHLLLLIEGNKRTTGITLNL